MTCNINSTITRIFSTWLDAMSTLLTRSRWVLVYWNTFFLEGVWQPKNRSKIPRNALQRATNMMFTKFRFWRRKKKPREVRFYNQCLKFQINMELILRSCSHQRLWHWMMCCSVLQCVTVCQTGRCLWQPLLWRDVLLLIDFSSDPLHYKWVSEVTRYYTSIRKCTVMILDGFPPGTFVTSFWHNHALEIWDLTQRQFLGS